MKRLLTGIKPTGDIHIGNYFGAMLPMVERQDQFEVFVFIADLHALNQIHDAKELKTNTLEIAKAYLAVGIDPARSILFRQSDISAVTELCWIFNSITPIAMMKRAHAYKDAEAKKLPINMGLFDYPILMAADILLYNSDVVPVGLDQQQHIEFAIDIARNFNNIYGETFKLPAGLISEEVATVVGLDGRKMSKSYGNTIGLFDSPEATKKKVMTIVTDSRRPEEAKDPAACNIFALHKLFSAEMIEDLAARYREGKIGYKESKELLAENINRMLAPIREKKKALDDSPDKVLEILKVGGEKARVIAEEKIQEIKERVGIVR
jgi:tryptophanyl-tRNA synthetase